MPEVIMRSVAPFVGREVELRELHRAFRGVMGSARPQFVLVRGDFGVGKTTLVKRFLTDIAAQNPFVLIGQGKCSMESEANGLVPFGQLLADLAEKGVRRGAVAGDLLDFIKEVAPTWLDIFATTVGVAGAVVKATVKTVAEGKKLLRTSYSEQNVFVQYTNAIKRLAKRQPIVAFVDDLHWADSASLRLLFHLARQLEGCDVLLICTYRPIEAMETGPNAELFRDIHANLIRYGATELEVQRGIDIAEYVTQRYPLSLFPLSLITSVQKATGGHALFVSQIFSLWEETGVIASAPTPDGKLAWRLAGDSVLLSIPQTISEVLKGRVRLIEGELREILKLASVEGEDFTVQVIAQLRQIGEYETCESLETLDRRYCLIQEQQMVEIGSTAFDVYRFVHRFFREYIYSELSSSKKRILHRLVGECLEALCGDPRPISGQLALHFREARELLKAANYALMAAQFEQLRYSWAETEKWCEFGLALVDTIPPEAAVLNLKLGLLEQSGHGHNASGRYARASQRYRAALGLAQRLRIDAEKIVGLCIGLAYVCDNDNQLPEALGFLNQGREILVDRKIPFGEAWASLEILQGALQIRVGNNDLASQSLRKVLADLEELPQTSDLDHLRVNAYNWLATALNNLDQYSEAAVAYWKAVEIAERIGEKKLAAVSLLNLADMYVYENKLNESESALLRAQEIAQQIGGLDELAYAQATRARILLAREKSREAISELSQAIALSQQIDAAWNVPFMHADLAAAYLALSDLAMAYRQARHAVDCASCDHFEFGHTLDVLAQVEAAQHNWEAAAEHFQEAIDFYQHRGDRHLAARAQRHFAQALLRQGKQQEATDLLGLALEAFQELGLSHEIVKTESLLSGNTP